MSRSRIRTRLTRLKRHLPQPAYDAPIVYAPAGASEAEIDALIRAAEAEQNWPANVPVLVYDAEIDASYSRAEQAGAVGDFDLGT